MTEDKLLFEKICNDLVELKDTSEMMMDLAYSAVLFNNRHLAEEVMMLEDKMDSLHTQFELLVLSSRGEPEEARGLLGLIRMGVVTERIADAAAEIAEVVLRSEETHPVLRMVIEDADETVDRVTVAEDSPVVGKTLKEARIPQETGMWVLAIRRGDQWTRPKSSTLLQAGDVLIASGYADGDEDFKKLVGKAKKHPAKSIGQKTFKRGRSRA